MIKTLTKLGNSKALVIDKATLKAAGLDENAVFQIIIDPNGGIIIQSVKNTDIEKHKKNVKSVIKKRSKMLKRLADK
jgi:antitoxin component of MazEF toxin-antitoxin module